MNRSASKILKNYLISCKILECSNALRTSNITTSTPTGGNRDPKHINFGMKGLVGHSHKKLVLIFEFEMPILFVGTNTDYNEYPYTITIGTNLDHVLVTTSGSHTFAEKILSPNFQVEWERTEGTDGIHFEFIQCEQKVESGIY